MKRYFSAVLRGGLFFVLLVALYFLVGLNFDKTKAGSQIFGFGTKGRIAVWVTSAPPAPGAPGVTLTASPATVASGGSATLTWTVSGTADSCTASGDWSGAKSMSGGSETRTGITSAQTYTLQCSNQGAQSAPASASVAIAVAGTPSITSTSLSCSAGIGTITANWSAVSGATSYDVWTCLLDRCTSMTNLGNVGNVLTYSFDAGGNTNGIAVDSRNSTSVSPLSPIVYQKGICPQAGFNSVPASAQYGKPFVLKFDGYGISLWKGDVQYPRTTVSFFPPIVRNPNSLFDAGSVGSPTPLGYYNGKATVTVSASANPAATAGDTTDFALTVTPTDTKFPVFVAYSQDIDLSPGDFTLASPTNSCTAGSAVSPVSLSWGASDGAIHYDVYRAEGAVASPDPTTLVRLNSPTSLNLSLPFTQTAVTDTTALKNKTYVYIVRAYDLKGFTDANRISFTTACVPTARLTASPLAIDVGASATLNWTSGNANSCTIDKSVGSVCSTGASCDTGGTKSVSPTSDTTYTLTCAGDVLPSAVVSATVTLNNQTPTAVAGVSVESVSPRTYSNNIRVAKGVPLTVYFAPYTGKFPSTTAISADADTEPAKGILNGGICEWNSDLSFDPNVPTRFDTQIDKTITIGNDFPFDSTNQAKDCITSATHTFNDAGGTYHVYRLTDRSAAKSNVADVTITTVSAPVITSFTATPNPINQDQAFTLAWASTGAASCSSPDADFNTVIAGRTSGSGTISNLRTSPKDYVLNCVSTDIGLFPTPAMQTVTVTIAPPVCASFAANPTTTLKPGDPSVLSWNVLNARTCSINQSVGSVSVNSTKTVNPQTATQYTLTCSGDGTPACSQSATVSPANQAPVAVAGISKDTNATRSYASSVDVKFGVSTPLYFSGFLGPKTSTTSQSSDPDGWTDAQNGVSSGGSCAFNLDLSRDAPATYEKIVSSPASPVSCEASQSGNYTFSDGADNDAQIIKPLVYNAVRIMDKPGAVSNEAQATVNVHYQPTATLSADKTSVNSGAPVALTWSSTHATSCTGTGFDTVNASSGAKTVNPTADTTYSVSCSGSTLWGPGVSAPVTVVLNGEYALAASRDIAVAQGATAGNTNIITATKVRGSGSSIAFSASGFPQGATAAFSPASCTPGSLPCATTLTMATTRGIDATPAGSYPIIVTGSVAGTPATTATFNLIVRSEMSVALSALPSALGPAPYVIQLKADAPAVDYTGDPGDFATYTFWKKCDTAGMDVAVLSAAAACGAPDYVASNVHEFSVVTTDLIYTLQGTYRAKVVVARKAAMAESHIDITVNPPFNYTLALDRSRIEMVQGTTIASVNRATITNISGTPTSVPLSSRVGNISASMPVPAITFSPTSCTPPQVGSCGSDISVSVARELPAGAYPVTVSAGAQTAIFTLTVTSRIDAALSALPSDRGAASLNVQLKGDASNYTGSAIDALNYSFWWDCNNTTDNPADSTSACGDANDTAVGYKINSTFQTSVTTPAAHSYATEGVYFAKVIIERGGSRREARIPITVGTPKVSVTCSGSPVTAVVNQPVTWTAVAARGVAPYGFTWTRDVSCSLNPDKCASVVTQYTSAGDKFGSAAVTDKNSDTASRLCDNSVKIYQPTLVITPPATQLHADGETVQLAAKYDPDGPGGILPETDVTINSSWSVPLSDQNKATVSSAGLVTSKLTTGNVTVSASYKDAFNNVIVATAAVAVISRDALICDPAAQTVRTGEQTFPMKASGGTGSYDWLVQEIDATPRSGSTIGSKTFTTTFSVLGAKTVAVSSGSQSGSCRVTVTDQNLTANLSAFPEYVTIPQLTRLTAVASGNALGTMNYSLWWDCGTDQDADNTTRVEIAEGRCGVLPTSVPAGQCVANQYGEKCNVMAAASHAIDHNYPDVGTVTPKVIIERGNAVPAQGKSSVTVGATNQPPIAIAGVSSNQNANRAYAKSIVVTQNVPTVIYFGAFTGTANAPDETSSDPNGWTNKVNGMYHIDNLTATGQCAWNADLDRNAAVSFEDVSGANRNPASAADCVASYLHNFAETGSFTYAVLRMTDNRGAVSAPALVTVDVVAPGAPIAIAGVSNDPSANRVYRDTVSVKQGEDTQLWVSAQRRVGSIDTVSSDPDGWTNKNGGVSKGGSCKWNRDLDRGVFPTGIPTYEWVMNDPLDPLEDCDTRIVNDLNTSFTRTFMDVPGTYAYEALRIFDNTGLRSNKALINVQVLPSAAPVAVATASTNNGATFSDTVTVVRGISTPIIFSAVGSSDPDGWTNPINGVSASGQCDWNNTLLQGTTSVAFLDVISHPASPAACNLASQTFTFNDRPGVIDYQVLKIADNKNIQSGIASISVRVTAPDMVVSQGPLPASAAVLVEKGSTTFTGKIKNQGDAATVVTFNASFKIDLGNDGSTDLTLAPTPVVAGLAIGAEKSVVSGTWSNLPAGTHKVTLCADQPSPAVSNEFFTENNCSSQVVTVVPDNRSPVSEAGISLDGITYGASITVLRGAPVQVWLSADKDVTGDTVASFDPDGWADAERGVASGGKCEWNLDFASQFAVQNTVNNPASPTICNRNRLDKTFNDPAGTYVYPVLRIIDAKLGQSAIAEIRVRVVASAADLTHIDCVTSVCAVAPGAGANVCVAPGGACTGGSGGGPSGGNLPDLIVSQAPSLATGELKAGKTLTFSGRIKNQGVGPVTHSFTTAFLIDIGNNGTIDARIPVSSGVTRTPAAAKLAALPFSDITLPLPASVPELAAGIDAPVTSGEWRAVPEGTHRVIICADSDNTVTESDETNNCSTTVMTVGSANPPAGPLHIDSCKASVPSARAGELVDWSATVSGGNGANSFSWSGDAPLEGTTANPVSVAYQTTGTKSGSVIVTSGNETASRSCGTVNVTPGILEFKANPSHINPGQSALLSWNTTGFASCAITADQPGQSIGAVDTNGTKSVQPPTDTKYTLTCSGASQSQSVTIIVSSVPNVKEVVPK